MTLERSREKVGKFFVISILTSEMKSETITDIGNEVGDSKLEKQG